MKSSELRHLKSSMESKTQEFVSSDILSWDWEFGPFYTSKREGTIMFAIKKNCGRNLKYKPSIYKGTLTCLIYNDTL